MVSVKRCTLPDSYIEAARKLIEALSRKYKIDYAFWYIKHDDDEEWYNGKWELILATEELRHDKAGISIVFHAIESLNIDLDDFKYSFTIIKPNQDEIRYYLDRIDIKNTTRGINNAYK